MRKIIHPKLSRGRIKDGYYASTDNDGLMGAFFLNSGKNRMIVMSSGPAVWEHVSVSVKSRCPTWTEMAMVKDLFWDETECVIQFHPPKAIHINVHPYCLHLWKPPYETPTPPVELLA